MFCFPTAFDLDCIIIVSKHLSLIQSVIVFSERLTYLLWSSEGPSFCYIYYQVACLKLFQINEIIALSDPFIVDWAAIYQLAIHLAGGMLTE